MKGTIRGGFLLAVTLSSSLLLAACSDDDAPAAATVTTKLASLNGDQETPAVTTSAFGAGVLQVNESTGAVSGFIVTSGLVSATQAHVHQEARGTAGGIIVPLEGGPDIWVVPDDAANLTAAQITAFRNNQLYFNAHTTANPNGEIRGQIDKTGTVRLASLDGAQETPPVTTTSAFGAGVLAVDQSSGQVSGFITTAGLTATQAHVHQEARGTAGGIIVPLAGGPTLWVVADGQAALTADQITAFGADNLYFNAHTTANPDGEIRGQIDKTGTVRLAALDGGQETPAVTTSAFGAGILAVDNASGEVSGFITTAGLVNSTQAHVHQQVRGQAGGIIVPLAGGPDLWVVQDTASALTADQRAAFLASGLYFNAHTGANPNGEIRGQIE